MSSDKKEKKQKRKDKRRRQAREKRGTLPPSVQALLGYFGGGGPTPAPQSDVKVRERAGVDNIDTLSQIIRQQQVQSASYMQNLQNMAFKNDMTNQLKEQSTRLEQQTSTQIKGVVDVVEKTRAEVEKVRQYNRQSSEEKIKKTEAQIAYQLKLKTGPNQDKIAELQANLKRYKGLSDFENRNKELKLPSYDPPSGAVSQKDMSLPKAPAQAGGGLSNRARALSVPRAREQQEFVFERAPTSSKLLSAVDVNAPLYEFARQQNIPFEMPVSGGQADVWDGIPMYQSNLEGGVSSGNPVYDKPSLSSNTGKLRVRTSVIQSLTADEARNSLTPSEISNIRSKPWSPAGGKVSSGPTSKPKKK